MTAVVVLAVAMGVIGLAAREGRRASRPGTLTADRPAADRWTPVVAVVAAGTGGGRAATATWTGTSRCACAARRAGPATGASGGAGGADP